MKNSKLTLLILGFSLLAWSLTSDAQTESILYSFRLNSIGAYSPVAGLTMDAAGNLYGAAYGDPQSGAYGVVFELAAGTWQAQILHHFSGKDGAAPYAAVTLDAAGNLYGTTYQGGAGQCTNPVGVLVGCGVVFKLTAPAGKGGTWSETVLHNFAGKDGSFPLGGVILDGAGNLYGTTSDGGPFGSVYGGGTVFELSPKVGGGWNETTLYVFGKYTNPNGSVPGASLIFDGAGNLYSTTQSGGANRAGTVFELSPKIGGGWLHTILHSFGGIGDGGQPNDSVIFDAAGNLYGTTLDGGTIGFGEVFELSPTGGGVWTETVLYSFKESDGGGAPIGNVTFDANGGNLYGTTSGAGSGGNVFKLSPNGDGAWSETIVHSFGSTGDGNMPYAGVIFDAAGNLFGTTVEGGAVGYGTVFEIQNP